MAVLKTSAGADLVRVTEWTPEGIKLDIRVNPEGDRTRAGDEEAVLRQRAQKALQGAGLLGAD
jgi:hypothetical protein